MNIRTFSLGIAIAPAVLLGGPSLALAASGAATAIHACQTADPAPNQAFLYAWENYQPTCWAIDFQYSGFAQFQNMWAGYDTNDAGFRNDDIRSIKVGSSVSIVMFQDSFGTASHAVPLRYNSGARIANLNGWNDSVSAIRLISGRLQERCQTANENKIIIWDDASQAPINSPDCNVLYVGSTQGYPNPASMAFRNDSISAYQIPYVVRTTVNAHYNSNYNSFLFQFPVGAPTTVTNLGTANNRISSIFVY